MLEIRTAILQRLYRDWDSRRGGREFPARADFDVLDFKYVIGQLALIDVTYDPLRFRFRLHGTGISQRVGYEMTGKELDVAKRAAGLVYDTGSAGNECATTRMR